MTVDGEPLGGGNASASVLRVGSTVRKPWLETTERTAALMAALRARAVDVPRHLGADEHGRQVIEYVPGRVAMAGEPLPVDVVGDVGHMVRSIHDASADLPLPTDWPVLLPAEEPDLLCHNDLATWNLVIDGDRLVFIDWDGAGPSTRGWDLAYAAISFAYLFGTQPVDQCSRRLRALLDGYGADASLRSALPATMTRRARAMLDLLERSHATGTEPWASMYASGHGETWRRAGDFIAAHQADWLEACTSARRT